MSITKSQAEIDAQAARDATVAAANADFISQADTQITEATALGNFWINMFINPDVDLQVIATYYGVLGYSILYPDNRNPDVISPSGAYPAPNFVTSGPIPRFLKRPDRLVITWK